MLSRFFLFFLCFGASILAPLGLLFVPGCVANDRFIWMNPLSGSLVMAAYMFLVGWFFLSGPDFFLTFRPAGGSAPIAADALAAKLEALFAASKEKDIIVFHGNDEIVITTSFGLKDFQGIHAGEISKTFAYHLRLDEAAHKVILETRTGQSEASAGLGGLRMAMFSSRGMAMEKSWTWKPSIQVTDGRPVLTVQQMKIDTGDVLNPLLETIRESGWSVRYGLFTPRWLKASALILAALCLAGSMFFLIGS